ncbi:GNAT family N-acetyltransferase [Actinoplanes sp. NPDC000266]
MRPLTPADAATIASWSRDPRFVAAAEWTPGLTLDTHLAFQLHIVTGPPAGLIRLAAVHAGELVGYVDLQGEEPHRRELGYVIGDSSRWGKGYGGQAARAGLAYGFGELGLTEIWAEALTGNIASIRILQRLGMTEIDHGTPGPYRRFSVTAGSGRAPGLPQCGHGR